MRVKNHFGIDFGTTNSSVVQIMSGLGHENELRHGDEEGRPLPSIVAIDKETGVVYTGRDAWKKRNELSQSCEIIPSIKSILDDKGWSKIIAGRKWTATDVAAEVFKALKNSLYSHDVNMTSATVAVPIGFSPEKRQALRAAAKKSGISVESFVSEPAAAFFANYDELKSAEHVVIFDWGGGTLDVSVLEHRGGTVRELATGGMYVAGDDIDRQLAMKIHDKVARDHDVHVSFEEMDAQSRDMLLVRAERAKRALSEEDDTVVSLNKYGEIGAFHIRVTYEWFAAIVESIVDKAIACLESTIEDSGEPLSNIDRVVMVGGSSNIGPLYDKMADRFGDKLLYPDGTVWSISRGAARLSKRPGTYRSAQSVGLRLSDNSYFPLLKPGDKVVGWEKALDFGIVENAEELRVVFSGSKDIDNDAERYQSVTVPGYLFLEEKLRLEAYIDQDLVFCVRMKSTMRRDRDTVVWRYDRLKFTYSLGGE